MNLLIKYFWNLGNIAAEDSRLWLIDYLNTLNKGKNITYLDCGCYDGELTTQFAKALKAHTILGIEMLPKKRKLAEKKGITTYKYNLNEKLSLKSNSVDVITVLQVLEHIIEIDTFFSEMKRILKKNGLLIIGTDNLAAWHNIFSLIIGNQPYTGPYLSRKVIVTHRPFSELNSQKERDEDDYVMPGHTNVMTTKALARLGLGHGFKVEKEVGIGYYPFPKPLANMLTKIDSAHCIYPHIVFRK